ncbi:Dna2/Cas4 domain-containing protein [bacterium]|nr:Dna2/Cas4 domain-containing protein [bacterium]MBU1752479.1 Dna2/Cas4 domain-containing protein [bacterium]
MYSEDDLIQLSALQHLVFCKRQCALIHIEQLWSENVLTAEGKIMHEKVDTANKESRGNIRTEYGVQMRSLRLGLIGKADVVEFHKSPLVQGRGLKCA